MGSRSAHRYSYIKDAGESHLAKDLSGLIYHQRAQHNDFWLRAETGTNFLTRRGRILDSRRTRQRVGLQQFALRLKARFTPFRDSAGCTIVMRWQRRLKSYFSEDQARFLETRTRHGSRFSASIFRRATNQPAIHNRRACVEWKEILLMSAERFGKLQVSNRSNGAFPRYCGGMRKPNVRLSPSPCPSPSLPNVSRG